MSDIVIVHTAFLLTKTHFLNQTFFIIIPQQLPKKTHYFVLAVVACLAVRQLPTLCINYLRVRGQRETDLCG